MKNKLKLPVIFTIFTLILSVSFAPRALAEDTQVIGNGDGSTNEIHINNSSQTTIQSTNNANISNTVTTNSNTGGNQANSNTSGDTAIKTGDAGSTTTVTNNANISIVNTTSPCNCPTPASSSTIIGNGAFSDNTSNSHTANTTSVNVLNNATITNNISVNANTGENKANYNTGGDTFIKTGNIYVNANIDNSPVNVSKVKVPANAGSSVDSILKITGNGVLSLNTIESKNKNNLDITVNNYADIVNNLESLLNTGNNKANDNTGGNVHIVTGDIFAETAISNAVNISKVDVTCGCEKPQPTPVPVPPTTQTSAPTPSSPSTPGGSTPSSSGPGGLVAGATANMLPVTGNGVLFFFMLANVIMLFLGAYLRLRSGNSPSTELAF